MEQFYEECINPASVDIIEEHAAGTEVSLLILAGYIWLLMINDNDELFEELMVAASI